jgi:hypothetical protein
LVVAGAGAYLIFDGRADYDDASSACASPNGDCSRATVDSGNDGRTRIIIGDVLLGVGVTAVGLGAVWWLATPTPENAALAVRVGPGRAELTGRF